MQKGVCVGEIVVRKWGKGSLLLAGGWLLFAVGTLGTDAFDVRCRVPICTFSSGLLEFCCSRQSTRLYYGVCAYTMGYSADVVGVCLATRVIAQVVHHPEQVSGFSGAVSYFCSFCFYHLPLAQRRNVPVPLRG